MASVLSMEYIYYDDQPHDLVMNSDGYLIMADRFYPDPGTTVQLSYVHILLKLPPQVMKCGIPFTWIAVIITAGLGPQLKINTDIITLHVCIQSIVRVITL